jgi:hypothetical protein
MTLSDVRDFQTLYIKDKPLIYCILGDTKDLDLASLEKLGAITKLTQEELFGY